MKITYLGHSCFFIEGEKSVVTDPFSGIGYPLRRVKCDYVLSSHDHFDHNATCSVDYGASVVNGEAEKSAEAISLSVIPSYHDEVLGKKRGMNYIYKFVLDGVTFTHLGDLGEDFNESIVQKIGKTDVLFVPVGGTYTVDGKTAARYVRAINPKIAVPMHYKTPRSTIDIDPVDAFKEEFPSAKNVPCTVNLDIDDLPAFTEVYVFDSSAF